MTSTAAKIAHRVAERDAWVSYSPVSFSKFSKWAYEARKMPSPVPTEEWLDDNFPVQDIDWDKLRNPKSKDVIQSTWIGHATLFVQMGGKNILTDPIFSNRCSGVQWAGPKRFRRPACSIEDMMVKEKIKVDVVLVSHNHYDHLDYNSVKDLTTFALKMNAPIEFVVPLGLKSWFQKKVPDSFKGGNKVTEIDWHESYKTKASVDDSKLCITGIPAQHWSNRYGYDRDKTLWLGFGVKVVKDDDGGHGANFLFAGDTGWFEASYDIGKKYGPFDMAAIPIGAYEPRWFMKQEHMNPGDAVKYMGAVQAKMATPIHWGTFPLTPEPILEPREHLLAEMKLAGKDESTFPSSLIGETFLWNAQESNTGS